MSYVALFSQKLIAHKFNFFLLILLVGRSYDPSACRSYDCMEAVNVDVALDLVGQSCLSLVEAVAAYLYGRSMLIFFDLLLVINDGCSLPLNGACSSSSVAIVAGLPLPPVD